MSGEIGVTEQSQQTILWRTLGECRSKGWITITEVSPGLHSVALTSHGRRRVEAASAGRSAEQAEDGVAVAQQRREDQVEQGIDRRAQCQRRQAEPAKEEDREST